MQAEREFWFDGVGWMDDWLYCKVDDEEDENETPIVAFLFAVLNWKCVSL